MSGLGPIVNHAHPVPVNVDNIAPFRLCEQPVHFKTRHGAGLDVNKSNACRLGVAFAGCVDECHGVLFNTHFGQTCSDCNCSRQNRPSGQRTEKRRVMPP